MYQEHDHARLILRDHLAIDRTVLANERTLLSYLRSGVILVVSAVTVLKLFGGVPGVIHISYLLLLLGALSAAFGLLRFVSVRRRLAHFKAQAHHHHTAT